MPFGSGRKKSMFASLFVDVPKLGKIERVKCKFCSQALSKNGTRMKNHITNCLKCPDDVKKKYFNTESISSIRSSTPIPATPSPTPFQSQTKVKNFIDKISINEQVQCDELLTRAIVASSSPLALVENSHWQEFLAKIRPAYKIPSRQTLATTLLDKEYTRVFTFVSEKVATAETVAVTCDGWSNIRNESIINFVVTTPEPVLYKTVASGKESHTAEYIAREIQAVINDIGVQKVFGLVTDNAANMKKAWKILAEEYPETNLFMYGCAAHGLNLLFSDLVKTKSQTKESQSTLETLIIKAKYIIKTVKMNHKLKAIFEEHQKKEEKNDKPLALALPVKTRFGSIIICLESISRNKHALQALAINEDVQQILKKETEVKKNILSEVFWDQVTGFLNLLKPILTAITRVESDAPRMSEVVEIFFNLENHFKTHLTLSPLTKNEEKIALQALKNRKEFCLYGIHKAAHLLDPSKCGCHLLVEELTDATELIFNAATLTPNINEQQVLADLANYRAKEGFFAKPFLWSAVQLISSTAWWKGLCGSIGLATVAVSILQLPATSAGCERTFSSYGNIHNKKRNRLTNERAAKLVYISHNLKLQNHLSTDILIKPSTSSSHQDLHDRQVYPEGSASVATNSDVEMLIVNEENQSNPRQTDSWYDVDSDEGCGYSTTSSEDSELPLLNSDNSNDHFP